jgi:hypothetical protein
MVAAIFRVFRAMQRSEAFEPRAQRHLGVLHLRDRPAGGDLRVHLAPQPPKRLVNVHVVGEGPRLKPEVHPVQPGAERSGQFGA